MVQRHLSVIFPWRGAGHIFDRFMKVIGFHPVGGCPDMKNSVLNCVNATVHKAIGCCAAWSWAWFLFEWTILYDVNVYVAMSVGLLIVFGTGIGVILIVKLLTSGAPWFMKHKPRGLTKRNPMVALARARKLGNLNIKITGAM